MDPDARTVALTLTMLRFSTLPENSGGGRCINCGVVLELHQPDIGSPDRLVGICETCGSWFVIDLVPGTDEAVMFLLPVDFRADRAQTTREGGFDAGKAQRFLMAIHRTLPCESPVTGLGEGGHHAVACGKAESNNPAALLHPAVDDGCGS
jgi:hypothetical protein